MQYKVSKMFTEEKWVFHALVDSSKTSTMYITIILELILPNDIFYCSNHNYRFVSHGIFLAQTIFPSCMPCLRTFANSIQPILIMYL